MHLIAPYATQSKAMQSRLHEETFGHEQEHRSDFQRDRDRIVHCTAFRRLVYKTQVFLNYEGDLFRTRMTHSLEVAQLSRSVARTLGLQEDLVEAIALAHDLGHTPFGHAGQEALNAALNEWAPASGGFEHNLQSLRVVDKLEERYPDFDGLNLCLATREGILKHCSAKQAAILNALEPDGVARRFASKQSASLEAQLVNLVDEMAYSAHDMDDGVRSGLISMEALRELHLFECHYLAVAAQYPALEGRRLLSEIIRRLLSEQVFDLIVSSKQALKVHAIQSEEQVRQMHTLIGFSTEMQTQMRAVKSWLFANLYRHAQVQKKMDEAQNIVRDMFKIYLNTPQFMPASYAQRSDLPRSVADYIAGMTDRFAMKEHIKLLQMSEQTSGSK